MSTSCWQRQKALSCRRYGQWDRSHHPDADNHYHWQYHDAAVVPVAAASLSASE